MLQWPSPSAQPLPARRSPTYTSTWAQASAPLPVIVGATTLVTLSPAVPVSEAAASVGAGGASGACVSIRIVPP